MNISNMTCNAKLLAGVEIDNGNIVGGDLYSTLVDVYYPDWDGTLQSIGYMQETKEENGECLPPANDGDSSSLREEEDHGICIPQETNPLPVLSVQALGVSTSKPGIVTIYLEEITPRMILRILKDFLFQFGSIDFIVSGGAHVKSPLGVPLSLGIICDNELDLKKLPLQIDGKACSVESVSTGWDDLDGLAREVREKVIGYHMETNGDIFNRRGGSDEAGNGGDQSKASENTIDDYFATSEMILDWHDF